MTDMFDKNLFLFLSLLDGRSRGRVGDEKVGCLKILNLLDKTYSLYLSLFGLIPNRLILKIINFSTWDIDPGYLYLSSIRGMIHELLRLPTDCDCVCLQLSASASASKCVCTHGRQQSAVNESLLCASAKCDH